MSESLGVCTNSIGSSMVMMWQARLELIRLIIAACEVDLPQPVGPVTSTSPRVSSVKLLTRPGSFSSSRVGIFLGMRRIVAPMALIWKWRLIL